MLINGFFNKWCEWMSFAFIETAEHFVVFQTKYLDTNDQTLHCTYKNVTKYDNDPVDVSGFGSGKHQDYFHHSCVADGFSDPGSGIRDP